MDDPSSFLTSGERQLVVLHLLNSLRAEDGDEVGGVTFREGEAIGESNWSLENLWHCTG